jgi:hypothetical protein
VRKKQTKSSEQKPGKANQEPLATESLEISQEGEGEWEIGRIAKYAVITDGAKDIGPVQNQQH